MKGLMPLCWWLKRGGGLNHCVAFVGSGAGAWVPRDWKFVVAAVKPAVLGAPMIWD